MQIQQMLENRIEELEMKIAFQEQLLDELNHALVQQQFDIDKMQVQLRYMANKLKTFNPLTLQVNLKKRHRPIIDFCNKFVQMKRALNAPFKLHSQIIIS